MKKKPQYKSQLERKLGRRLPNAGYETEVVKYVQPAKPRKYTPDFILKHKVYIEAKGHLKLDDRQKHIWIREQHPDIKVYFVFANPNNKIKKNSPTTYADWCNKNGFEFISIDEPFPKHWEV